MSVLARYLINDLAEVEEPFILVLDDYHRIRKRAVHDLVTELVTHPSQMMSLALVTRRDLPLPLSALRARGPMTEIRVADLRFGAAETAAFLEQVVKVPVDDATATILEEKTEGWVTGLRLTTLSFRDREDLGRLARDLSGGFRHIADYLVAEVVSRQPKAVAACMMVASLFDRCDRFFAILLSNMAPGLVDLVSQYGWLHKVRRGNGVHHAAAC